VRSQIAPAIRIALFGVFILLGATAVEGARFQILLMKNGAPVWVQREDPSIAIVQQAAQSPDEAMAATLERMARAQLAGPTTSEAAAGLEGLFPPGSTLDRVSVADAHAMLQLTLPEEFLHGGLDELTFENIVDISVVLGENTPGLHSLSISARASGESEYRPLSDFLPALPPPIDKAEMQSSSSSESAVSLQMAGQPTMPGQPQPTGALTGASIFLSPGHGWYYSTSLGRWATQRPNTNNLIEDLSNGEWVLQYLCQYLWNAGARVYTCRERDLNTHMVIVDNGGAGYSETGTWTTESPSSGAYNGSQRRATTVTGAPTATATFTPNIPAAGYYAVYVWYHSAVSGSTTTDARITIRHTGGSTVWTQNQTRDGVTWKYIGTYYFDSGSNAATGSVVISNQSATAGNQVIADAARFGGGMGDMVDPDDPAPQNVSGKPRWEESGRYYAGFMGKSDWANWDTVWAMPRYVDWECEDSWEGGANNNAIYLSWHTNAPNPGRGTSSFAYSSAGWGGTFNGVAGGDILRNYVHNELINDIRAGWDPTWQNRGVTTANFGEINPNNNNDMPAALTEIAFHDTAADAVCILDPNFRRLAARAAYQGIVKFFYNYFYLTNGNAEFNDLTLLPEPPTNLRVTNNGSGGVTIAWNAPPYNTGNNLLGDAATGYRVYRSVNGKGFDNGVPVAGTSTTSTGLTPGEVYYFRVTATNSGGESFPTETLAVRVRSSGSARILIVNGFDRIDRFANIVEDDPYDPKELHRGYLWLMNTYDYIIAHAQAIDAYGLDFDSCSNEAVIDSQINLSNYYTVVWILGEESERDPEGESTGDDAFSATEQSRVSTFLNGGGRLFLSGSEIGYDLDEYDNGRTFYENVLHADYMSNDANTYSASGTTGSIFDGISLTFDNGSSIYNVDYPDIISANAGSIAALNYTGSGSIEDFDDLAGWWDPNSSGQTNAHADSTFTLENSITHGGSGSGHLYYRWDTGNHIREYNSSQTLFPSASNLSLWVYGNSSGHQVRITLRDPVDIELFANNYTTIDFTGWREITWNDIANNPGTRWYGSGDNTISGSTVIFDSIEVHKLGAGDTGDLYFDDATFTPTSGGGNVAAIQYSGDTPNRRIVMLGFPFETITSTSVRNQVMESVLDFFATPTPTPTPSPTPTGVVHVRDYTFDSSMEGWSFLPISGAGFSGATSSYSGGRLAITSANDTTSRVALWNGPSDISYVADNVYRASFVVSSSQATASANPQLRIRWAQDQSLESASHVVNAAASHSYSMPTDPATKTYACYFAPILSGTLSVAFDMLDFSATQYGTHYVDSVTIERFPRPAVGTAVRTYTSSSDFANWQFLTDLGYGPVTSGTGTGTLSITSTTAGYANYGFWQSSGTANELTYVAGKLYRATYTLRCVSDAARNDMPQVRLRCQNEDGQMTQTMELNGQGPGGPGAMPTVSGTDYDVYWETPTLPGSPTATEDGFIVAIGMLDFDPVKGGTIYLDSVTLDYLTIP
jgi:N-acetylmuramoyl-L-alanine amidase